MNRKFTLGAAPHVPPISTVGAIMRRVLYALCPGIAAYTWFAGAAVLVQILLATGFALLFETVMLKVRGQPTALFLNDWSAVVTAVLFALCLPPLAPWWIACVGMFFAIVIAKHLFGGLGRNVFNPAMVGYVVVLLSFPQAMTQWLPPLLSAYAEIGFLQGLWSILTAQLPVGMSWDALTQTAPIDSIRTSIAIAYAAGGIWLMWRRVITWHVPAAMIGSVLLLGFAGYLLDPGSNPAPLQQAFSGTIVLGAFFIATDPVSGCTSPRGRLVFGAGVGIVTLIIRRWGAYPDGVAFAVVVMNMAAPLIDRYTQPRFYGR